MKRSTAIGHLVEMADVASQRLELGDRRRWPLSGMWVTGELLTLAETLDAGAVCSSSTFPPRSSPGWPCIPSENRSATNCGSASDRSSGAIDRAHGQSGITSISGWRGSGALGAVLIRPPLMHSGHGALIA